MKHDVNAISIWSPKGQTVTEGWLQTHRFSLSIDPRSLANRSRIVLPKALMMRSDVYKYIMAEMRYRLSAKSNSWPNNIQARGLSPERFDGSCLLKELQTRIFVYLCYCLLDQKLLPDARCTMFENICINLVFIHKPSVSIYKAKMKLNVVLSATVHLMRFQMNSVSHSFLLSK